MPPDDLTALSLRDLADGLAAGRWTSREIVTSHLERADQLDQHFRALRCTASDALEQADESDDRRTGGVTRGVLDGIPVLIKDNIDVLGLPTTGGALALDGSQPPADAFLVTRLRDAGAIVLGKTNLSELANFLTDDMPSGYSSLGGQVLNPYDTSITPSGSSSGSGVAVALGLAPVAIGSETDGSITSPASMLSIVGMKPTLGLVSRRGILPIAPSQDTAGPMARTVEDAALLLEAIAGRDPVDPATERAYLDRIELDGSALVGARIGVVHVADTDTSEDVGFDPEHEGVLSAMRAAGATLVDVTIEAITREDELFVMHYEFAPSIATYFSAYGSKGSIASLEEIQSWNRAHADDALKFGQTRVDEALRIDHELERDNYVATRARDLKKVTDILEGALAPDLEALVFPGASGCSLAARAGWPSIVVPAGYQAANRRPVGAMLVSRPWTDARLLALAYALEQANPARRTPEQINPALFRHLAR